jgi:hypothetical protein
LSGKAQPSAVPADDLDDDALLAELGIDIDGPDVTELRHVRSAAEKKAAEEIANREACEDFDSFKPLFEKVQAELASGVRQTKPFELKAEIQPGSWFIVGGQKAYVADMAEVFSNAQGRTDARLRVIFDNGTESNLLMRSLQRALHKDDAGRRITIPLPDLCSPIKARKAILRAGRYMFCEANPIIPTSWRIGIYCIRSA